MCIVSYSVKAYLSRIHYQTRLRYSSPAMLWLIIPTVSVFTLYCLLVLPCGVGAAMIARIDVKFLISLCAVAMPRMILFLFLAALVGRLKSILTTSFSFWPWEHSPCLSPSVISSSSISWKEFAFALLLNLFAFSRFSFLRLARQCTFWKKDAGSIL